MTTIDENKLKQFISQIDTTSLKKDKKVPKTAKPKVEKFGKKAVKTINKSTKTDKSIKESIKKKASIAEKVADKHKPKIIAKQVIFTRPQRVWPD